MRPGSLVLRAVDRKPCMLLYPVSARVWVARRGRNSRHGQQKRRFIPSLPHSQSFFVCQASWNDPSFVFSSSFGVGLRSTIYTPVARQKQDFASTRPKLPPHQSQQHHQGSVIPKNFNSPFLRPPPLIPLNSSTFHPTSWHNVMSPY